MLINSKILLIDKPVRSLKKDFIINNVSEIASIMSQRINDLMPLWIESTNIFTLFHTLKEQNVYTRNTKFLILIFITIKIYERNHKNTLTLYKDLIHINRNSLNYIQPSNNESALEDKDPYKTRLINHYLWIRKHCISHLFKQLRLYNSVTTTNYKSILYTYIPDVQVANDWQYINGLHIISTYLYNEDNNAYITELYVKHTRVEQFTSYLMNLATLLVFISPDEFSKILKVLSYDHKPNVFIKKSLTKTIFNHVQYLVDSFSDQVIQSVAVIISLNERKNNENEVGSKKQ